MTGVQISVSLQDLGIAEAFDRMAAGAEDMTDLMDRIGSVLINGTRDRIGTTNVDLDGTPWPQSLRVKEFGGKTLHLSGELLASVTSEAAPHEVTVGSNKIYAGVHQTGATITPKNGDALSFTLANGERVVAGSVTIPARPYLGISEAEGATIEDVTGIWFNDLLGIGGR